MTTKILGLLGSLASLTSAARAQGPGRFDSLTTAAQVQRWVRVQPGDYTDFQNFMLTDSVRMAGCAEYAACTVPGGSWLKADFDGNGRTDLLVAGYAGQRGSEQEIICFLDSSGRVAHPVGLSSDGTNCVKVGLCYVGQRAALRFAHMVVPGGYYSRAAHPRCRIDTLLFTDAGFVEYNRAPHEYGIQQVTFSAGPCYGRCPVFTLQIAANGKAIYQAQQFNQQTGSFTTVIDPSTRHKVWQLLNYLDFPRLDDRYAVGATDLPSCTLAITYTGGQVKTIRDYGQVGTFGLQRVYELLFSLRNTQQWK